MKEKAQVILVDDESDAVLSLNRALKTAGFEGGVHGVSDAAAALNMLEELQPQVMVIDLSLEPERGVESGFSLLSDIISKDPSCRVIVLTGHGSVEYGVRALELGAASFLEKPADIPHLLALVKDGIKQSELRRLYISLQSESASDLPKLIVGESDAVKKLRDSISYLATTLQPVLITGETGTGKGLCARAIHELSERGSNNFVRYQPHFGSADMIQSDLFGHIKGAFTGATEDRCGLIDEANAGTLFLDEVDELPVETQISLLGVLQDKRYRSVGDSKEKNADFRLICATNQDIERCVSEKKLREDFFHRVAHQKVNIPPLRDRTSDIELLSEHILLGLRSREQVSVYEFQKEALSKLCTHNWPGNVRELEAVIEGAAYRAQYQERPVITIEDISLGTLDSSQHNLGFHDHVQKFKGKLILEALERNEGNQVRAAKELGIDRSTLRRVLEKSKPFMI